MRLARSVVAASLVVLVAACGSTVEQAAVGVAGGPASSTDGLTAPTDGGLSSPAPGAPDGSVGSGTTSGVAGPSGGVVVGPDGKVPPGATAGAAAPGTSAAGRETGPILLGVLYAVNDGAAPAGIDNGNTITPGKVLRALVASWNKSGGIGGRKIEPVYAELHSYDNDYEGQIAAACSTFTEDHHVAAVVMTAQYYSESLLSCLAKAGVLLVSGDFIAPDRQDAQRYPWVVSPLTQLGEDREASLVSHLADDGFLSLRNKVGVIVEDCPVDNRIYANGLVPALRSAHVPLASTFRTQCFQSIQDFGQQTSQMSSAVLQFRRASVDRVIVVSAGAEANITFAFSEVAENQGYRPGYALTSVAIPVALQLNAPAQQMENMRGVGWLPILDSTDRAQSPTTSQGRDCLRRLKDEGVSAPSNTDLWTAWSGCETFAIYDALLRAASGDADPRTLLGLSPRVASSYVAAATNNGRVGVRDNRIVPTAGRIFAFNAAKQFHYVGNSFRL
jgi:ABC-type branched-subunit amino acid transport system substrate-binding protein